MRISVVGLGYVGLIQAAGAAKIGHEVIGVDIDEQKVREINDKIPPIYEEGLPELLQEVVPNNLKATENMKEAVLNTDVTFICVGTPSKKEGSMSLHQLENVMNQIGEIIKNKKFHVVVIKSTVVPGTCEEIVIPITEAASGKKFKEGFSVVMNPEFLREGQALKDFFNPDRIVLGSSDKKAINTIKKIYSTFKCPIVETEFKEAELIKYASNALLATKISFINEIGNIAKRMNIDTNAVAKGVGLDARLAPSFLRAGIGFGGSCFPKDVNAIVYKATEKGYNPRLLRAVLDVNRDQPLKMVELIDKTAGPIRGKKIGLLGLTFKAGTDDIRESPALTTIKELLLEEAELNIYDPKAMDKVKRLFPHLTYFKTGQEVVDESEIIVILTEWEEFKKLDYGNKLVIDGKNLYYDGNGRPKHYEGICW